MFKLSSLAAWLAALSTTVTAMPHESRKDARSTTHQAGYNNNPNNHQVISGGRTRTYAVSVPASYNANLGKQWPMIIDYHGNNGSPDQQYRNSEYDKYPKGQEYIVVYPQGVESHWQGPTYAIPAVDDLQFTTDLVSHLKKSYCIDPTRLYASGKSNGAGFVDLLACSSHGDQFSAFAMASAALYTDLSLSSCTKRRAILESHGDLDATIPYHPTKEGSGGPLPDISAWVSWWGTRTCGPNVRADFSGDLGGYNTTSYSCGGYINVVQHYQVFNLGHCWPSSTGTNEDSKRSYCGDRSLDFTGKVLDFFGKWNLGNAPR